MHWPVSSKGILLEKTDVHFSSMYQLHISSLFKVKLFFSFQCYLWFCLLELVHVLFTLLLSLSANMCIILAVSGWCWMTMAQLDIPSSKTLVTGMSCMLLSCCQKGFYRCLQTSQAIGRVACCSLKPDCNTDLWRKWGSAQAEASHLLISVMVLEGTTHTNRRKR